MDFALPGTRKCTFAVHFNIFQLFHYYSVFHHISTFITFFHKFLNFFTISIIFQIFCLHHILTLFDFFKTSSLFHYLSTSHRKSTFSSVLDFFTFLENLTNAQWGHRPLRLAKGISEIP